MDTTSNQNSNVFSVRGVVRGIAACFACLAVCSLGLIFNENGLRISFTLETKAFATVSLIANFSVLYFYYVSPAADKFRSSITSRTILQFHVVSGICELLAAIAFFVNSSPMMATVMAIVGLTVQVPTSLLLTINVFGMRAIMWPAYLVCTGLHTWCAFQLLLNPSDPKWVMATFLVLNIYVWVRVYYYILGRFHLFTSSRYSAAILIAGVTVFPFVFGPSSPILILMACLAFIAVYRLLASDDEFKELLTERPRDSHGLVNTCSNHDDATSERRSNRELENVEF